MGRALVVAATIVIVVFAALMLIGWLRAQATKEKAAEKGWALKGDLNKTQEREIVERLEQAATLLRDLATPPMGLPTAFDATLLSSEDRGRVETWLRDANKTLRGISIR